MALTERSVLGAITLLEDGPLQLREDIVIERDGVEVARLYHRRVLAPGVDTSSETARVRRLVASEWTPEVIAAYETRQHQLEENVRATRDT